MLCGFVYLAAVVDSFSRSVLARPLSITLEAEFNVEAMTEALARHGWQEIANTDQGSVFTSGRFTGLQMKYGISASIDGRGALAWMDC